MDKHQNTPKENNEVKRKNLKTYFDSQKEIFRHYLSENIATCSMVSNQTGIPQKNLTRYKTELEDNGALTVLFVTNCKVTGFKAQYLTTNTDIIKCFKL